MSTPTEQPKFYIGQPCYQHVNPSAHGSFAQLMAYTPNVRHMDVVVDTYLHKARSAIANRAIEAWKEGRATHLFWADSDIIFDPFIDWTKPDGTAARLPLLYKLLSHHERVVSGVYYKHDDARPVAMDGEPVDFLNKIPDRGLIRAAAVGMGVLLMDIGVLSEMKDRYKDELFQMPVGPNGETIGEDVFFFQRLYEMKIPLFVDCDVQCGHMKTEAVLRQNYEDIWETGQGKDAVNATSIAIGSEFFEQLKVA